MKKNLSHLKELASTFPAFPALVPSAYRFFDADGSLWLGYANNWLRLRSSAKKMNEVLALINGSRSLEDILTEAQQLIRGLSREQVIGLLEALMNHGFLQSARPNVTETFPAAIDHYNRHSRDLEFFSLFETATVSRYDYLQKIMNAKIVVLGLGGVGSWATLALACGGVGSLVGVDFDTVELSNLSRQILFTPNDIGQPKATATGQFLVEFSSNLKFVSHNIQISGHEDIPPLVEGADCVILAADWPFRDIARWVNQACWTMQIPSIYMSGNLSKIWIGPMVVPHKTSCRECYYHQHEVLDEIQQLAREAWVRDPMPALAPIPSLAGHLLAWEILCYLTGIQTPQSLGRALELNLHTMEIKTFDVPTDPSCPVCQRLTQ